MFPWAETQTDRSRPLGAESVVGKRRAGRSGSATLPSARRRRTTSSTWRPASSWATRRTQATDNPATAGAAPAPTVVHTTNVHGKVPQNDDGFMVRLGNQDGFRSRWYCGRILDPSDIPGSSDQCGPDGGPQCHSCARFQSSYEPDLNDDGFPVKRSTSVKSCYLFYCGRRGVVAGTGGTCGPEEGPQCPSCQRLQQSFKASHFNDEGCTVVRGTEEGYTGTFYCGRVLGTAAIPGSDGRCGPANGPQCASCKRFQASQLIIIDAEPSRPQPVRDVEHATTLAPERQAARFVATSTAKVKKEVEAEGDSSTTAVTEVKQEQSAKRTPAKKTPGQKDAAGTKHTAAQKPKPRKGETSEVPIAATPAPALTTVCSVCGTAENPEELLLCDAMGPGCLIATHLGCCRPPLKAIPKGDWYCAVCQARKGKSKGAGKSRGKGRKGAMQDLGNALKVAAAQAPRPLTLD
mmetsp:Transcript_6809/g.15771  ORF Transcript_6809/g.15771 Transcript_6809/m.15771 type:complete len:463 (-) Transcript_6809:154-1542(-)